MIDIAGGWKSRLEITGNKLHFAKKSQYHDEYQLEDPFVIFHEDDKTLKPIKVDLPKFNGDIRTVRNYGLPPEDQVWSVPNMPKNLAELNSERYTEVNNYWDTIKNNYDLYQPELWFIREHWNRRHYGEWIFINGKLTYISPWHYMYLTSYDMDTEIDIESNYIQSHPEYRSRDWKYYIFKHFAWLDPFCLGVTYPKMRREGASNRESSTILEIWSREKRVFLPIQSMTEPDARKIFEKMIVPAFKAYPFYFIPVCEDMKSMKRSLYSIEGKKQGSKSKRTMGSMIKYLNSKKSAADGDKGRYMYNDEAGKTDEESILERHQVNKKGVSVGGGATKTGFLSYTSTVGKMSKGVKPKPGQKETGAKVFKKLCAQSMYEQRNKNGQTISGLYNLFLPSHDGLEGFIDRYGNAVIDTPTEQQVRQIGRTVGSKEYLENSRQAMLDSGDINGYIEEIRQQPNQYKQCFSISGAHCHFNEKIITERLEFFSFGENPFVQHGTFEWVKSNGQPWHRDLRLMDMWPKPEDVKSGRARVRFVPLDEEDADWEVSYLYPRMSESNQCHWDDELGRLVPSKAHQFGLGGDPFKNLEKTSSGHASNQGGVVFRKRNSAVDTPEHDSKDINPETGDHFHVTSRFCAVFDKRPEELEALEQLLMASVYYGCKLNPEMNVQTIYKHMVRRGFEGWLFYRLNPASNRYYNTPGCTTTLATKYEIYNLYRAHINMNGHREVHPKILEQALEIRDDMGDYDAFTAGGYALMEAQDLAYSFPEEENNSIDLSRYI